LASFEKDYTGMHGQQNIKMSWPNLTYHLKTCPARMTNGTQTKILWT